MTNRKRIFEMLLFLSILSLSVMMFSCSSADIKEIQSLHKTEVRAPETLESFLRQHNSAMLEALFSTEENSLLEDLFPSSSLPASLQIIEDEAFENTALHIIHLPEYVESIGDKAFAHIPNLKRINIPGTTKRIAETAFIGSECVAIASLPNSYARTWAKENRLPFVPLTVLSGMNQSIQTAENSTGRRIRIDLKDANCSSTVKKKQQNSLFIVICSERYDGCIEHHYSGRAPPVCI